MIDDDKGLCVASGEPRAAAETVLVLGFDGQPASRAALIMAIDLAERLRARLEVVHGVGLKDYPIDPDSDDWEEQAQQMVAGERAEVQDALAGHSFGWSYHAGHGDPVAMLVQTARSCDALAIVVGTRGEGAVSAVERLLDRSVSHGLVHAGDRPVLIVPGPA